MLFANHHISESAEDQLLLQIQGVIAEFEREKIIERGRRGKMHRAKSGKEHVDADLVFVDRGVSGTTLVRPALDALRDKAMLGAIDTVVVLCPDRLARKHAHQ